MADFYCAKAKLVVELDGSQHYEEEQRAYDEARADVMAEYGLTTLRFLNREVDQNFVGVCEYIDLWIREQANL